MGDFATEIICCQQNAISYPSFGLDVRKDASFDSNILTCDSVSESWSTPKMLSPEGSNTLYGNDFKWYEVPLEQKNLFNEKNNDSCNSSESEYKYYTPRRVSSLKTNRTPPGTPKSKAVRFADALGLDLEDIRHVFNLDLPPKIPASARHDLNLGNELETPTKEPALQLVPNFSQPGAASDFLRRVRMHNVSLENSFINNNVLTGTIRVMNITFQKKITVRVSFNEWKSYVDFIASYVQDSHDGITDRFSFSVLLPLSCQSYGNRIHMALGYECSNGSQYWDNNFGQNYVYSCVYDFRSSFDLH